MMAQSSMTMSQFALWKYGAINFADLSKDGREVKDILNNARRRTRVLPTAQNA